MSKKTLVKLPISVSRDEALDLFQILANINRNVGRLSSEFEHSRIKNSMLDLLLMEESVYSNIIEGTQVTLTDMMEEGRVNPSWKRRQVLSYYDALLEGISYIQSGYPISTHLIKTLHRTLIGNTQGLDDSEGEYRKIQNFIGFTSRIEEAVYIPVEANEIDEYTDNLHIHINSLPQNGIKKIQKFDDFIFDETCDPIIKIAIMHAQFESIHPFLDGNGRMGRILIAVMAINVGLVDVPVFFVSEEFKKEKQRYYSLLNGVRGDNPDWYAWIKFFIQACGRVTDKLLHKLKAVEDLADKGLMQCTIEANREIWLYTFSDPYTIAERVAENLRIPTVTARKGLKSLSETGLLYADKTEIANRKYRNYDLIRIFN